MTKWGFEPGESLTSVGLLRLWYRCVQLDLEVEHGESPRGRRGLLRSPSLLIQAGCGLARCRNRLEFETVISRKKL